MNCPSECRSVHLYNRADCLAITAIQQVDMAVREWRIEHNAVASGDYIPIRNQSNDRGRR